MVRYDNDKVIRRLRAPWDAATSQTAPSHGTGPACSLESRVESPVGSIAPRVTRVGRSTIVYSLVLLRREPPLQALRVHSQTSVVAVHGVRCHRWGEPCEVGAHHRAEDCGVRRAEASPRDDGE